MAYSKLNNNLKNYKFNKTNYYYYNNNNKLSLANLTPITSGSYGTIYNIDPKNKHDIKEITSTRVYTKKIKKIKT
jgi:hypothetical protein